MVVCLAATQFMGLADNNNILPGLMSESTIAVMEDPSKLALKIFSRSDQ